MKLIPINRNEIPDVYSTGYKKTKNFAMLNEFIESGMDAVRIDAHNWKTAQSGAANLRVAIKRFGFSGICVLSRGDNIYLIKEHNE